MHKNERVMKEWRGEVTEYWKAASRWNLIIGLCQHLIIWQIALFLIFYLGEL